MEAHAIFNLNLKAISQEKELKLEKEQFTQ